MSHWEDCGSSGMYLTKNVDLRASNSLLKWRALAWKVAIPSLRRNGRYRVDGFESMAAVLVTRFNMNMNMNRNSQPGGASGGHPPNPILFGRKKILMARGVFVSS